MGRAFLGEFEQRVLLAVLRCGDRALPIDIRREVGRASGGAPWGGAYTPRSTASRPRASSGGSREAGTAGRDGLPDSKVPRDGRGAAGVSKASRKALLELWSGLDKIWTESWGRGGLQERTGSREPGTMPPRLADWLAVLACCPSANAARASGGTCFRVSQFPRLPLPGSRPPRCGTGSRRFVSRSAISPIPRPRPTWRRAGGRPSGTT